MIINNKYEIIKEFETLGDTQTYLAQNIESSEKIIIKELIIGKVKNWKSIELFNRETKVLRTMNHKFIPKYLDAFHIDSKNGVSFYLVQEYINGINLQERIDNGERFSIELIYKILDSILGVLLYLESLNPPVIHRDIKPSNIIMKNDSSVYLIDFGAIQSVNNINNIGTTIIGTTGFMAPEQLMGKASTRSDLYSLGVTIISILSHQNPINFPIKNMKLQYSDYVNTEISSSLKYFIDKLIEPDSDKRFQNVNETIEVYKNIKSGKVIKVNNKLSLYDEFEKKRQLNHSKGLDIFSIIFLLLVMLALAFLYFKRDSYKTKIKTTSKLISKINPYNSNSFELCIKSNLIKYRTLSIENLKSFECENLNLTSYDIQKLKKFKSLRSLNLTNNKIEDISIVKNLKKLKYLYLSQNKIFDLTPIANLKRLSILHLYNNKIFDLTPLKNLDNLESLLIFSNKINEITPLSKLTNLKTLHLGFNKIKNIKPLYNLINLRNLNLGYNKISSLDGISDLVNLINLKFENNNISDISNLKRLKRIQWLDMSSNNITDISSLKNLTKISYLLINNNNITDISSISYLENLETLWASQNNIKKIPDLSKLKKLKRLSLWKNDIKDLSPLKNVEIQEELDIQGNNINDFSFVSHIKNVKK